MLVYDLDSIKSISLTIKRFDINIDDFLKVYIQIEKNDKYEPVFSLTDKYKSFPINSSKSTKNFFQNNKWKINNSNVLKINQDIKFALNKLSLTNYDKIKNDIITILKNNKIHNILDIFIKELFEKIWFDEKFIDMYVKLSYDLSKCRRINYNFNILIKECRKEFNNRKIYKNELSKATSEEQIFINKRKIFGTIEFISYLYIKEYLNNDILKNIIDSLLSNEMNDLDYECFYKLWSIINDNNRLDTEIIHTYKNFILKSIPYIRNNRLRILLESLLESMFVQEDNNNINYINNCILEFKQTKDLQNTLSKLKKLNTILVSNELIMNELENKSWLFIDIILLLNNKSELIRILNDIDLNELEIDIPNIKTTFEELKEKLKI
jgi:hypothetical protein